MTVTLAYPRRRKPRPVRATSWRHSSRPPGPGRRRGRHVTWYAFKISDTSYGIFAHLRHLRTPHAHINGQNRRASRSVGRPPGPRTGNRACQPRSRQEEAGRMR